MMIKEFIFVMVVILYLFILIEDWGDFCVEKLNFFCYMLV